ncbi:putative oligomerization/nucleic acid binding protein [Novosphingobium sp. PhB55]|uniref:SHOCT domain-containing protein n=1 Tax=Novosphingobium sp. PhB55 TaxID=2485106 RepID=UPI0010F26A6D|nr:SHOCT domain-containing protein [Novosphingobium sp. PhB55]TDW62822.1 putative oligomerization/nucleic acid binding protein [Novosphingobium sp. PhB55]
MSKIEQFERLHQLRENGVLTEAEFQAEKQKLISGEKETGSGRWRLFAAAAGVGVVVIGGAVVAMGYGSPSATSTSAPTASASAVAGDPGDGSLAEPLKTDETGGDSAAATLQFAVSPEAIGANPGYLEQRLGVPKVKTKYQLVFDVSGCRVEYGVEGNAVSSIDADVTASCQPTVQGVKITPSTTYGQIHRKQPSGTYIASCLSGCGNAADPTVDLSYPGSRSNQFLGLHYSAGYDQVTSALERWDKAVRAERGLGEFDTPDDYEAFSCVAGPPDDVSAQLEKVRVRHIQIREEVDVASC